MARKKKRKTKLILKRKLHYEKPVCCWCNVPLDYDKATLEHLTPKSQGGKLNKQNIALACYGCNSRRGMLSIDEFLNSDYLRQKKVEVALLPASAWDVKQIKNARRIQEAEQRKRQQKPINFQILYFKNQILI